MITFLFSYFILYYYQQLQLLMKTSINKNPYLQSFYLYKKKYASQNKIINNLCFHIYLKYHHPYFSSKKGTKRKFSDAFL